MWGPRPSTDPRRDLAAALAALEVASAAVRHQRALARLVELAGKNRRIRHRDALTDPARVARVLGGCEPDEREAIEIGDTAAALGVLYGADRELSAG
jgi:hypothetical protein